MRFWEAMKAIEEGKKVRQVDWEKEDYIYILNFTIRNESHEYGNIHIDYRGIEKEWELYQEPVKTYTFQEIIPFLKEGKKVKRKNSHMCECLYLDVDGDLCHSFPKIEDLEATDWILVD
jgi:hypothetical protein